MEYGRPLPIDAHLGTIVRLLEQDGGVVVEATPGAGKTTRVPRALLEAGLAQRGSIVVLEPRRLAARLAAERVAAELGQQVGNTVGYQVRFENRSGPNTKIRFVTEGIFTRQLSRYPTLEGVSVVVIDELHERHLQGDLALAWCLALRKNERPDLKLVAMSATLDGSAVAKHIGSECVRCDQRSHAITILHAPKTAKEPLELQVAMAVRDLCRTDLQGHILVFLPGAQAIRRAAESCRAVSRDHGLIVLPLHGQLPAADQDRAIAPSATRKLILATNVAETSLTIDGVAAVIDSGLCKRASHNNSSGLSTLALAPVSQASATQRAGRAGRTQAGRCLRLYTEREQARRPAFDAPEISRSDLAELYLCVAERPRAEQDELPWLDDPPAQAWSTARALLRSLEALDEAGRLTDIGRSMRRFPTHPRLARVLVEAESRSVYGSACRAVAVLTEGRPILRNPPDGGRSADTSFYAELARLDEWLDHRVDARSDPQVNRSALHGAARASRQLQSMGRGRANASMADDADDALTASLLVGFADRVACRQGNRDQRGPFQLGLASGATMSARDPSVLGPEGWCLALDAEERPHGPGRLRRAIPLERDMILEVLLEQIDEQGNCQYDAKRKRITVHRDLKLGSLLLDRSTVAAQPSPEATALLVDALLTELGKRDPQRDRWLSRARFAARQDQSAPPLDDDGISAALTRACDGLVDLDALGPQPIRAAIELYLGPLAARLGQLAPDIVTLDSGVELRVNYGADGGVSLCSYLQDFFGVDRVPTIGRASAVVELWAPNGRTVQVTRDLDSFWREHYPSLRKALSRRYPKHHWPEKPLQSRAVRLKRHLGG